MAINRFYTPSLPEYTSQFVEDKTPWDSIIGLEQEKLQRGEKALDYAAQTDALTGSLTPGYRTQDIAPQVTSAYKQKMDKWMQDYGESSYSIPALRALTKINAEFRSDPNVKLIQQDREASSVYEQMRKGPNYRPETDPNIDPTTGQVRQFGVGQSYNPYDTPIEFGDLAGSIRERFGTLKSETISADPEMVGIKGADGTIYDAMRERNKSAINPETLKQTKEALIEGILKGDDSIPGSRYQKAIAGEKWNEDYVRRMVEEESKPFAHESFQDNYSWAPGQTGGRTTGPKPGEILGGLTLNTPATLIQPGWNPANIGETPAGEISKAGAVKMKLDQNTVEKEMSPEYYKNIKGNPEYMLNPPAKIMVGGKEMDRTGKFLAPGDRALDFYGGGKSTKLFSDALIKTDVYENPTTAKEKWDNYFSEKEKTIKPVSKEYATLQEDKKRVNELIDEAYKTMKIDESPFKNEFDYDRAIYAAKASGVLGTEGFPFKNEIELLSTSPDKLSGKQKIALRANAKAYENERSKDLKWGEQTIIPNDVAVELAQVYGGATVGSDGRISGTIKKADAGTTWNFEGSRMMKYDKHGIIQEVTPDEKKEILKAGTQFTINSKLTDRTSDIGSGMLAATIGKEHYFVEGPKEWVDAGKLDNSAYSYELPNRNGVGDVFTVKNAQGMFTGAPIDISNRWDYEHAQSTPYDVSMLVRDNPRTGRVELVVFDGHPMKGDDKKLLIQRQVEDGTDKGYKTYTLGDSSKEVDPILMDLAVSMAYYDKIHEKNPKIDLSQEKQALTKMTQNYLLQSRSLGQ
jgi:hypothetical protein